MYILHKKGGLVFEAHLRALKAFNKKVEEVQLLLKFKTKFPCSY